MASRGAILVFGLDQAFMDMLRDYFSELKDKHRQDRKRRDAMGKTQRRHHVHLLLGNYTV